MGKTAADQVMTKILAGTAPGGLRVSGHLDLSGTAVTRLPAGLTVDSLDLSDCAALRALPPDLTVRRLTLSRCPAAEALPPGFHCYELEMRETAITTLPPGLQVDYRLDLEGSYALTELPRGLKVGSLSLRNCPALESLPEDLAVYFLDISNCPRLEAWPATATVGIGRITARNCTALRELPAWLTNLWQLDLRGCINLTYIPDGIRVSGGLDLADVPVQGLPPSLRRAPLQWRGVPVDHRIVFQPETITAAEVSAERNTERRRVLLERMGYDNFIAQAHAQILDSDTDTGGPRQLLRVSLPDDEPLVCVAVRCPSTARQYVIRVPPTTKTCRQASAWIAGFDNADDYAPLMET
jgi:hypothetical protein